MDPEERLYAALDGKKTDRIPTVSILADPNIMNQVMGWKPTGLMPFLQSERGARIMPRIAGPMSRLYDLGMWVFGSEILRMNYRLGFDGAFMMYWPGKIRSNTVLEDIFGRSFDIVDDGYGNPYMMYRKGLIKSADEWRRWPRPPIAAYVRKIGWLYRLWRIVWQKKIAVIPFVAPGLWENSWQPMDFSSFVVLMRKDPEFVREAAGYFTALCVASVDEYCAAGARVLVFGDDLAYKSGPMISPRQLEEFYGQGYRQITAAARRYGAKIFIHCCGNTNDLVEKFVEWGFDGAHAFEPSADNDLAASRAKVGDRLCFVGNIDITHTLVEGSREEVEAEVQKAIRDSAGGGFILGPAHTHASISAERVRWMLEAARNQRG